MEKAINTTAMQNEDGQTKGPQSRAEEVSHEAMTAPPVKESTIDRFWLFELFAWAICTMGLVSIAIILRVYQGQPMPSWSHEDERTGIKFAITINAVISLFGTLVKSTLLIPVIAALHQLKWIWFEKERPLADMKMFEGAGKGPLGSLMLMWSMRGKTLACLGAAIVVASLGVDFSLQQLITFPLRPAEKADASVVRTNAYTGFRPSGDLRPDGQQAEMPMLTAAFSGVYNYNSRQQFLPEPSCSTGNCTWAETYTSLGVCSRCYDVSESLIASCGTFEYQRINDDNTRSPQGAPIPYCNYSFPMWNGFNVIEGRRQKLLGSPALLIVNDTAASFDTYFGKPSYTNILAFTTIRSNWTLHSDGEDETFREWYNMTSANATECGLEVCVKRYRGAMNKAIFSESIEDVFTDRKAIGLDAAGNTVNLVINAPSSFTNVSDSKDHNTFTIDATTMYGLGTLWMGSGSVPFWSGAFLDNGGSEVGGDNDQVNYLRYLNDSQVTKMMESIASSMTLRMREAPGHATTGLGNLAKGIAYQHIPHVNVRWGWITLPAALVFLTLVFLLVTMIENAKSGSVLWKSNGLASFYYPLTKEGRDELQKGQNARVAEEIAEDLKVKWRRTDAGVRLVQSHGV